MKFRHLDTYDAQDLNDWIAEEWRLTYSSKDDILDVLHTLEKSITDFRQKYSNIKTNIVIETAYASNAYTSNAFDLSLNRKLSDEEKFELNQLIKAQRDADLKRHKRKVKAEAKKLGLL